MDRRQHTNGSNDLCLETKLVLEAPGKVSDAALAVTGNVGDFSDVVEHVAGCEEENHDDADGGPEVAVLEEGEDVGTGDGGKGEKT